MFGENFWLDETIETFGIIIHTLQDNKVNSKNSNENNDIEILKNILG